ASLSVNAFSRTVAADASESIGRKAEPPDMMAPCSRTTGISMETGRKRRGKRRVNKPGKVNSWRLKKHSAGNVGTNIANTKKTARKFVSGRHSFRQAFFGLATSRSRI